MSSTAEAQNARNICIAMGVDPASISASALRGYWTIIEAFSPLYPVSGDGTQSVIALDGSGGFLLQSIVTVPGGGEGAWLDQFQVFDSRLNRDLFSNPVSELLFHEENQLDAWGLYPAMGARVCNLHRPYYFHPNANIEVERSQRNNETADGTPVRVFLIGYKFQGAGGPSIPPPNVEFYAYAVPIAIAAGATTARGSVLVEAGYRFTCAQISIRDNRNIIDSDGSLSDARLQVQDARLGRDLFLSGPLPAAQLFMSPAGPRFEFHEPYTYEPNTLIQVALSDIGAPADAFTGMVYLIGFRERI